MTLARGSTIVHEVPANGLMQRVVEWRRGGGGSESGSQSESGSGSQSGSGGTALLLHGYMDAAGTWGPVAERLVEGGLRVLAPDLRGFGEGPRAPSGSYYHFADYVADVAAMVVALGKPTPLLLIGHSMGGTIATLYAGAFPERVAKVALLEGLGPPDGELGSLPDRLRRWVDGAVLAPPRDEKAMGSRQDALKRLSANHPKVPPDVLRTKLEHLVRDVGEGRVAWRSDPLHKTMSPTPFFAAGFRACAQRIKCPTLYVSGGPDGFHVPDEEERLKAFPALSRATIPDAGHMMHWTRPDALSDELLRFFRARVLSDPSRD